MQAITSWADVAFSSAERDRHLGSRPVSQLYTWPVVSPVNASRRPSWDAVHHSGSGWLARPSPWGTCTSYSLPANWRTLLQVQRVKALCEPAVDRREQVAGLISLPLVAPQSRHAHSGA